MSLYKKTIIAILTLSGFCVVFVGVYVIYIILSYSQQSQKKDILGATEKAQKLDEIKPSLPAKVDEQNDIRSSTLKNNVSTDNSHTSDPVNEQNTSSSLTQKEQPQTTVEKPQENQKKDEQPLKSPIEVEPVPQGKRVNGGPINLDEIPPSNSDPHYENRGE